MTLSVMHGHDPMGSTLMLLQEGSQQLGLVSWGDPGWQKEQ